MTPRGTRPPHLRLVGSSRPEGSPVDSLIDAGGRELLAEDNPVAAETWASAMLDVFERARWRARLEGAEVPPFEATLLERCRARRDRRAAAVVTALAGVVPPPHDRLAGSVAKELRRVVAGLPTWVQTVGSATPTRSVLASDVFGDQDSLIVGFAHEGAAGEHALVVLVDHNLSGQAKDAWIGADFDEIVAAWTSNTDPHMRIAETATDEAMGRLRDAMAASELWNGDTELRTEDFAHLRALVWARLRRVGLDDDRPAQVGVGTGARELLVRQFMTSPYGEEVTRCRTDADAELLAHHIVDLRCDAEGRPLRWSPTVVSLLLGDLAPRKLMLDPGEAALLPAVVRAFVRFSADRTGLDPAFVDETLAAVEEMEPELPGLLGDPVLAGPAKAVLAALEARGVDLTDLDAVKEALDRGGPLEIPDPAPRRRRRPADAPADVVSSAEGSPVLARFGTLTTFFASGRQLTQTGRPRLADAKELVALLGTRDRIDPTFGDRTFTTRSAAELPELGFTIRWALAAGALRKEHGRLRATTAWTRLGAKPLARWMKAAEAVVSMGPLTSFQAENRYRSGDEILDDLSPAILRLLMSRPVPFDEVLDWVCDRADREYEWLTPIMQDPEHRRTLLGWDLDLLARILGWAGMVDRLGARSERDRYEGDRLVGGTLELTTAGRWWLDTH